MLYETDLLRIIADLPDEFSLEEAIDKLIILEKIDVGMKQSDNGETFTTVEARAKLSEWL